MAKFDRGAYEDAVRRQVTRALDGAHVSIYDVVRDAWFIDDDIYSWGGSEKLNRLESRVHNQVGLDIARDVVAALEKRLPRGSVRDREEAKA
jgi:hypothetical protein